MSGKILQSEGEQNKISDTRRGCEICLDDTLCLHAHIFTHRDAEAVPERVMKVKWKAASLGPQKQCDELGVFEM